MRKLSHFGPFAGSRRGRGGEGRRLYGAASAVDVSIMKVSVLDLSRCKSIDLLLLSLSVPHRPILNPIIATCAVIRGRC